MNSIFHFWLDLFKKRENFANIAKLEDFPFDMNILSCENKGIFPDLAIKLDKKRVNYTGGELIELKDSDSYTVSSFNSTVPSGRKKIDDLIVSENSGIYKQMKEAGDDIFSLTERDVFYLVRGRKKDKVKICLIHGSFFETVSIEKLIEGAFAQVFEERLKDNNIKLSDETKNQILSIFTDQNNFSKVRNVDNASVKLRFRIMTEVKAEGNILNSKKYPEILDDTLSLIVPFHSKGEEKKITSNVLKLLCDKQKKEIKILKIKHPFNGYFLVFQATLYR